ncbi:hypothetical protein ACFSJM_00040 [Lactococcus formosensis subsp. bovis]|uniref:hypothetical protein n=1 Tax=Lactococcus formosensis TaxID=1281486 RepID=UPI001BCBF97E|nr:hypothetical protein [Lactococcus formosensis]
MNKKTLLLCFLGVFLIIGGTFAYFSLDSKNEADKDSIFIAEEKQEKDSSEKKKTSTKVKDSDSQSESKEKAKQPLSKDSEKEKDIEVFNETVLSQDYYLEKVENGKLHYEKATEERLRLLEKQAGDKNLSHYQVLHEGKMISVLTGNEEGTDT